MLEKMTHSFGETCVVAPVYLWVADLLTVLSGSVLKRFSFQTKRVQIATSGENSVSLNFGPSAGPLCPSQTVGVLQSALRGDRCQQGPKAGGAPARSLPLQRSHCGRVQRLASVRLSSEVLLLLLLRIFKAAYLVVTAAMHHCLVSSPSLFLCHFITGDSSAISFVR